VRATIEYLPRGMKLKWYFPNEDEVQFEFWVPKQMIEAYEWIGFAMQSTKWARNNFVGDYYILVRSEGVFTDRYLNYEGNPMLDTDLGGTSDILESSTLTYGNYEIYALRRLMVTDDDYDIELVFADSYMIKWALGVLENGEVAIHDVKDMGFEYCVFDDIYEDRNSDERNIFGPFLDYPPEYERPPAEMKPENFEWSMMIEENYLGVVFDPEEFYISDPEGDPAPVYAEP
jgi:hypothetical protein